MAVDKNCLGCGIELKMGEVCFHCLYNNIVITQIHSKTGKTKVIGADGKEYKIWFES